MGIGSQSLIPGSISTSSTFILIHVPVREVGVWVCVCVWVSMWVCVWVSVCVWLTVCEWVCVCEWVWVCVCQCCNINGHCSYRGASYWRWTRRPYSGHQNTQVSTVPYCINCSLCVHPFLSHFASYITQSLTSIPHSLPLFFTRCLSRATCSLSCCLTALQAYSVRASWRWPVH